MRSTSTTSGSSRCGIDPASPPPYDVLAKPYGVLKIDAAPKLMVISYFEEHPELLNSLNRRPRRTGRASCWIQASSSAMECGSSKTSEERRAKSCASRSRATGKRSTAMPFTRATPAGYSFFHVM